MTQVESGPFFSGTNKLTKKEAASHAVESMSEATFKQLQEDIQYDRTCCEDLEPTLDEFYDQQYDERMDIPESKEDLLDQQAFKKRQLFVSSSVFRRSINRFKTAKPIHSSET